MNPPYHAPPQSTAPNGYGRTIGLTKPGSLFFTLPTRGLTGQQTMPSVGRGQQRFQLRLVRRFLAEPRRPDLGREDHRHAVTQFGAEFVRLGGDDREAGHPLPGRHAVKIAAERSVALLPPWRLRRQPGSPKRSSHRIAAGGRGGSETFFRSRCGDFCGCCGWPGFQSLIKPHCQRDPTAFRVDL